MRPLLLSLIVVGSMMAGTSAGQKAGGAAAGGRVGACSILTKDIVAAHTTAEEQALTLALKIPPEEEPIGATGSMCSYGGVTFQLDPFPSPQRVEADIAKTTTRVAGVGDVAYFRDNRGMWAELYVRQGSRVITLQVDVPNGKTAEAIKPNTVALAKALLAMLK